MSTIFRKLALKNQTVILVLNAPDSFKSDLEALKGVKVWRDARESKEIGFALVFVKTQQEVEEIAKAIANKAKGDAVVWLAYPKGPSKKYKCELNRDRGWDALGNGGFERVSQVAIDEDWSALRFRRVEFINTMTRRKSFTMTNQGKVKTTRLFLKVSG